VAAAAAATVATVAAVTAATVAAVTAAAVAAVTAATVATVAVTAVTAAAVAAAAAASTTRSKHSFPYFLLFRDGTVDARDPLGRANQDGVHVVCVVDVRSQSAGSDGDPVVRSTRQQQDTPMSMSGLVSRSLLRSRSQALPSGRPHTAAAAMSSTARRFN
jgi:hypothetical protein